MCIEHKVGCMQNSSLDGINLKPFTFTFQICDLGLSIVQVVAYFHEQLYTIIQHESTTASRFDATIHTAACPWTPCI